MSVLHAPPEARSPRTPLQLLRTAIRTDPSKMDAYGLLGQMYIAQGRLEEAQAELEVIAERQPRDISALTLVGMLFEAQGRTGEAIQRYEAVLERDPRMTQA